MALDPHGLHRPAGASLRTLDRANVDLLRAALAELVQVARVFSDLDACPRGRAALKRARLALRVTDG